MVHMVPVPHSEDIGNSNLTGSLMDVGQTMLDTFSNDFAAEKAGGMRDIMTITTHSATAVFESPSVRISITRVSTKIATEPTLLKSLLSRGLDATGAIFDGKGLLDLGLGALAASICKQDGY